jgi:hypothetical protein
MGALRFSVVRVAGVAARRAGFLGSEETITLFPVFVFASIISPCTSTIRLERF